MNEETFLQMLKEKGIELNEIQIQQFRDYYALLVEWNEKMNLTAITDQPSVYLKHFYDSISLAFFVDLSKPLSICDVGAGAGFPSIPLKIVYPELKVTIIDSLNKRIKFLNHLSGELKLDGVAFVHGRAEDIGQDPAYREQFDLTTARAVARLSVLAELCIPFVKQGGQFVSMKAASGNEELNDAQRAIKLLGAVPKDEFSFILPIEESERNIYVFDKIKSTPKKYPRKPGIPGKSPIIG